MKKRNGFSIVEMLVVLALISFIAVVSILIGRSVIQRNYSTTAVNSFVADVTFIKQAAAKENRYFSISFNNNGTSYDIQRQTTVGNLTNWTHISKNSPLDGKEFFDQTMVSGAWSGFAVSPIGLVYSLPVVAGAVPTSQSFEFRMPGRTPGQFDYVKSIRIYSNGGIKID